jgi:hypothetical protein
MNIQNKLMFLFLLLLIYSCDIFFGKKNNNNNNFVYSYVEISTGKKVFEFKKTDNLIVLNDSSKLKYWKKGNCFIIMNLSPRGDECQETSFCFDSIYKYDYIDNCGSKFPFLPTSVRLRDSLKIGHDIFYHVEMHYISTKGYHELIISDRYDILKIVTKGIEGQLLSPPLGLYPYPQYLNKIEDTLKHSTFYNIEEREIKLIPATTRSL